MSKAVSVLVVGCGNMGGSHALAYHNHPDFDLVGLVGRTPERRTRVSEQLGGVPTFADYEEAVAATNPNAVSINTYPDTHAPYAVAAFEAGRHVFLEKPVAETLADAERVGVLLAVHALVRGLRVVQLEEALLHREERGPVVLAARGSDHHVRHAAVVLGLDGALLAAPRGRCG